MVRGPLAANANTAVRVRAGQSEAAWAQVAAFYDHFLSFATLKDFAWSDEHNPAAAPNRKVRIAAVASALPQGRSVHAVLHTHSPAAECTSTVLTHSTNTIRMTQVRGLIEEENHSTTSTHLLSTQPCVK